MSESKAIQMCIVSLTDKGENYFQIIYWSANSLIIYNVNENGNGDVTKFAALFGMYSFLTYSLLSLSQSISMVSTEAQDNHL